MIKEAKDMIKNIQIESQEKQLFKRQRYGNVKIFCQKSFLEKDTKNLDNFTILAKITIFINISNRPRKTILTK